MGTRRKSPAVLELAGAYRKNPARKPGPGSIPQPPGELGDPPPELTGDEQRAWREIAADAPPGTLTGADRMLVELASRLMAKARDGTAKTSHYSQLRGCLTSLGLSPVDRARVSVAPKPKKSRLAEALGDL
jgi:hypothetical protein